MRTLIKNARVLTLAGHPGPRRGRDLGELGIIPDGDVLFSEKGIEQVGVGIKAPARAEVIEAKGRVLMPGFVDCHTHACWAGDRLDEWDQLRQGVPYLEILKKGGGIHATVRAVRAASEKELAALTRARLDVMLKEGTTTVEVKSGYGLSTKDELKMLRAIRRAAAEWPGTVISTALLGHAFEGNPEEFAQRTIEETLPAVTKEFPGIAIDAFCEKNAWSPEQCKRLFERALAAGHPFRVHTDQFNSIGMIAAVVALGARSADHLEASSDAVLGTLAASKTFGVILPCTGFHTGGRYANARGFVDQGGALALATNYNPGSAPVHSMPLAIAIAVRYGRLSPAEAITACTWNAASVLGFSDRGAIQPGSRADLILLRHCDERTLAYEVGGSPVERTVVDGAST